MDLELQCVWTKRVISLVSISHIIIFMPKVIQQLNHENLSLCQIQLNLAYHSPNHFSCFSETPFCPRRRQERGPQQWESAHARARTYTCAHTYTHKGVPFNGVVDKQRPSGEGGKTQVPTQDVTCSSVSPREWQPGLHSAQLGF